MSLLDNAGGSTNAGATGSGGSANAGDTGGNSGSGGQGSTSSGATSWRDSLPEELKNDPSLQQFTDLTNLAKSYLSTKSMVGKKGAIVPAENASDEEWSAFYKSIGQPELEKFDLKTPENANPEVLSKFKEFAHKAGMTPRQAQKYLDQYLPFEQEMSKKAQEQHDTFMRQQHEELKKEWGQGYDSQLSIAKKGIMEKVSDTTRKWLQDSGAHSDPNVMRMAAELAKGIYGEDTIRGDGETGRMGLTPKEIDSEIKTIMANPAYFDRNHPMHKVLVGKAEELFKKQAGV